MVGGLGGSSVIAGGRRRLWGYPQLLSGDGYLYAVRESLDTYAGHAFTAETIPIGLIAGINPPAGFGVDAGPPQSIYAGQDVALQGKLLGADSTDSRVSIRWRFLDKAP